MATATVESKISVDDVGDSHRQVAELHAAVDMLVSADLTCCGNVDLDVLRGATQRLRSFAAATDTRIARRRAELWASPSPGAGGASAGEMGTGSGDPGRGGADCGDSGVATGTASAGAGTGRSGSPGDIGSIGGTRDRRNDAEAAHDFERARAGELMASFEAALEAGHIDVTHLDSVVSALRRLTDDDTRRRFLEHEAHLLTYAKVEMPQRFRRRCNDLVRSLLRDHGVAAAEQRRKAANLRQWQDHRTGMCHLHLELDEQRHAVLDTAIEAKLDELRARDASSGRPLPELRVEAFMELVTASSALQARAPEVIVLIDLDTLRTGVFGHGSISETTSGIPVPPETVRRMACDGGIIPTVMGAHGVPLDVGRTQRLATRTQRHALQAMYATCAHPQCSRPFSWCRIHHIVWWELGGTTDLHRLIPLCDRHHHQVHEGRWQLTMTPDRVATWTTPDGTVWFRGDTRDRAPASWERPPSAAPNAPHRRSASTSPGAASSPTSGAARHRRHPSGNHRADDPARFDHDHDPAGP